MKVTLLISQLGDVVGTIDAPLMDTYPEGVTPEGNVAVEVDTSPGDLDLFNKYYYDFDTQQLAERSPRPSPEHLWDMGNKEWFLSEPLRLYKIAGMVNPVRDYIEASPVQIGEYWVDVDTLSEKRMADALEFWQGPSITWTMADNAEVALTEGELEQLYSQCRLVRAQRSMVLHTEARQLKSDLETTYEQVMDWQGQWLAGSPGDPYYPPSL